MKHCKFHGTTMGQTTNWRWISHPSTVCWGYESRIFLGVEMGELKNTPEDRLRPWIWMNMVGTLWWTNILLWKITIFNGKIHYFYGHFQLQTVSSPEGTSDLGTNGWWHCDLRGKAEFIGILEGLSHLVGRADGMILWPSGELTVCELENGHRNSGFSH